VSKQLSQNNRLVLVDKLREVLLSENKCKECGSNDLRIAISTTKENTGYHFICNKCERGWYKYDKDFKWIEKSKKKESYNQNPEE